MGTYSGPIVDVDVHHRPRGGEAELHKYLPRQWRDYVKGEKRADLSLTPPGVPGGLAPAKAQRLDFFAEDSYFPGSNWETTKRLLLDKFNYYRAVLTFNVGGYGRAMNADFGRAVCRAANDWNIENWLDKDERFYSVITVPWGDPAEAVKEIRRIGKNPRMCAVHLGGSPLNRPMGDPVFHPIYKAAAEMGLAISVHAAMDWSNMMLAVGGRMGYIETISQLSQQAMHYTTSLITNGVFEKYPNLHVVLKEYGVAWMPSLMWRLDQNYHLLRMESPWVKRWPSEYIRDHIRLSTQPLEESPPGDKRAVAELLQSAEGMGEILCFSTDYPHYSMDEPRIVANELPSEWLRAVFCDNACKTYGWPVPAEKSDAQLVAAES
jgi:predicted TIM-barrel fold metal-dependent hydrolase